MRQVFSISRFWFWSDSGWMPMHHKALAKITAKKQGISVCALQRPRSCPKSAKFPAQGIQQGIFSRKKKIHRETRINTDDLRATRELAGNLQGIRQTDLLQLRWSASPTL